MGQSSSLTKCALRRVSVHTPDKGGGGAGEDGGS